MEDRLVSGCQGLVAGGDGRGGGRASASEYKRKTLGILAVLELSGILLWWIFEPTQLVKWYRN